MFECLASFVLRVTLQRCRTSDRLNAAINWLEVLPQHVSVFEFTKVVYADCHPTCAANNPTKVDEMMSVEFKERKVQLVVRTGYFDPECVHRTKQHDGVYALCGN